MSDQPSNWPPPKTKSYAWLFALGVIFVFVAKLALVFTILMNNPAFNRKPPQLKDFEDLDVLDKSILQNDSVYGDYLEWVGVQDLGSGYPETLTRKLVFDESGKFATKIIVHDTTGFTTPIAGNDLSGRWTELNGKLTLKFYFPPERWSDQFDSVRNVRQIEIIDGETIELDPAVDTVWIMGTPCVRKNE